VAQYFELLPLIEGGDSRFIGLEPTTYFRTVPALVYFYAIHLPPKEVGVFLFILDKIV